MKLVILIALLGYVALSFSSSALESSKNADKEFVTKQLGVLRLFYLIQQPSFNEEFIKIAEEFKIQNYADFYKDQLAYKTFLDYYNYGEFLPRGAIFSIFNDKHLEQVQALFKLFYYAKDYDTFYKTAVWARQYFNEGLFLYTFSVALLHRSDTKGIIIPPIYEVYPHYFFNAESLKEVEYYKQTFNGEKLEKFEVFSNYSGYNLNLHPEQSLSYFTEDIGLNAYYYYFNLFNPFWLTGKEFNLHNNHGEVYYYLHQQLLSRFYLERLSNGFGEIHHFNYDIPFETPYKPSLTYPNGVTFPERPKFAKLHEYFYNYGQKWSFKSKYGYSYSYVQDYERRIIDAIDAGFTLKTNGDKYFFSHEKDRYSTKAFNTIGALIAYYYHESAFPDYYGHYEAFARHLLGYSEQPLNYNEVVPSALEHYETSLRDPAFYQLYKRIVLFFQRYKSYLPSYTEEELTFNGVKIEKFDCDTLETYFDYFKSEVNNAVYYNKGEYSTKAFRAFIRQKRLNHKEFNYNIHVKSDKDVKAIVKIYLGPKYDEYGRFINIRENRFNFVQLDDFEYIFRSGDNIIRRSSNESRLYSDDFASSYDLYEGFKKSTYSQEFSLDYIKNFYKFPRRLMLPKGSENGIPFQFFVFISPYIKETTQSLDGYPLGYPFDRPIRFEKIFHHLPNSYFYDAKVYHKFY